MTYDNSLPTGTRERVRGMILGVAVGDALGWPQEQRSAIIGGRKARRIPPRLQFREWQRNSGSRFGRYKEAVHAGEYSDDTQLMLAVARACMSSDWRRRLSHMELPLWPLYQRGGGRAVLAAARHWAAGRTPWTIGSGAGVDDAAKYFEAGANGVAMRIAPHVVATIANSEPELLVERVIQDGICTHGHPRALVGGVLHALALRHTLLRRSTHGYGDLIRVLLADPAWQRPDELERAVPAGWSHNYHQLTGRPPAIGWKHATEETRNLLEIAARALDRGALVNDESALADLGCFDPARNGAGHVTAVAAAYITDRSAARPQTGLLLAAYLDKADTDTVASMVASLLGTLHGTSWMKPLDGRVQDSGHLSEVARQLPARCHADPGWDDEKRPDGQPHHRTEPLTRRDIDRFRDSLEALVEGDTGTFPDGRAFSVLQRPQIPAAGNASIKRWRLLLADDQTVVIDRLRRDSGRSATGPSSTAPIERSTPIQTDLVGGHPEEGASADFVQLTLAVRDLDRSARFYHQVFGLPTRLADDSRAVRVGTSLVLVPEPEGESRAVDRRVMLTMRTDELTEVWKAAQAFGVDMVSGPPTADDDRIRLRDPDGYAILVQSRPSKSV